MRTGSSRSRLVAVAVMTATFAAGIMVGYAVPRLFADEVPAAQAQPAERAHDGRREHSSIFDQLNLTPAQEAKRDSILEKRRHEMDAFWEQHGPAMRAIVDSTRAEIDRMLTPEQLELMQEFREKRKRERESGGEGTGASGTGARGPGASGTGGNGRDGRDGRDG